MDVRPLPEERDSDAARSLAEAFFDYPTWDALAPRAPARRRAMISRAHLYVHTIGVDPRHQRRGVGRELVSLMTDRADEHGRSAFLMTSRRELVAYYRGFGFGSVGQLRLPRGVAVWQ